MTSARDSAASAVPLTEQDTFADLLVQTSFEIIAIITRIGAEHDLSLTLVRMLGILRDRTLTMAELADYLGLERSTVSGLADRAERRGFVARKASDADGRSTRLGLTAEGADLARHASRTVAAQLGPLVEQLPGQLRESLPALLTALRQPGRGAPNLGR